MCCHTFHCHPPALSCSVLLPRYLGLEIKRLRCCCHDVCLQSLNAPESWCLHLTTSWQLPNKTERDQATTVVTTNRVAEQCEGKKGLALRLGAFLLAAWHRHAEGRLPRQLVNTCSSPTRSIPQGYGCGWNKSKQTEKDCALPWDVCRSQKAFLAFVFYLSKG